MTQPGSPTYARFADVYDVAYHFVDYAGTAASVIDLIRARHPRAKSLLEVACGTGRYLELFTAHFDVEGLDLSPEMLARAKARLPTTP